LPEEASTQKKKPQLASTMPTSPRKITNRYVPIDCQTAIDDYEISRIGEKIMGDVSRLIKQDDKNTKTVH